VTLPAVPLLEAQNLERRFGAARALAGVSLSVFPGECHLITGPNGAGKTTLLRVLAGLARPSRGAVRVAGEPLAGQPLARRGIGLLSHQSQLYGELTPIENLEFAARLYGVPDPASTARAGLAAVGLSDRGGDPVRSLSRGMVQRVAIARAVLHRPSVLLLDEPFSGLDVQSSEQTLTLLSSERSEGRGLVLVTHDPHDAWDLATHTHLLVRGVWALGGPRDASVDGFLRRCREALHA